MSTKAKVQASRFQPLFDKVSRGDLSHDDAIAHIVHIAWADGYTACRDVHKIDNDPNIEIDAMLAAYEEYTKKNSTF